MPRSSHKSLHAWYARQGRKDLPWRNTDDAYAIWVSEIMLQQTQVSTVLARYYYPFLEKFPTIEALAEAPERAVLKAWEGLGYYQRARNLHKAAKLAAKGLPKTVEELLALPGIGRNTAHAIAAFAYHQPVPVLEANVKRVIARFFALVDPSPAMLWEKAEALLDRKNPFDYNQAMMDIGALICTPRNPRCGECPLSPECKGKTAPERYPAKQKQAKRQPVRERVLMVYARPDGKIGLEERSSGRLLSGLYGFPQMEAKPSMPKGARKLGDIRHVYSHFVLQAEVWKVRAKNTLPDMEVSWYSLKQIADLPLSRADHKVLQLVIDQSEGGKHYTQELISKE